MKDKDLLVILTHVSLQENDIERIMCHALGDH